MVSVIVPVYNTEPFLEECIQSIVNQTYRDLDIILINDGSTDGSGSICRKWERLDKRIRYVEKENEGQGIARNAGIWMAEGEYIIFVDSDDYIDENLVAEAYGCITKENAEICVFSHNNVGDDIYREKQDFKIVRGCSAEKNQEIFSRLRPFVWEKMYSSRIIKRQNITMSNLICEDLVFNAQLYARAGKICILDIPLYYYRYKREGNLSTNYNRCPEIGQSVDELAAIFKQNHEFERYWIPLYRISFDRLKDALFRVKKRTDLEIPPNIKKQYDTFWNVYKNCLEKWFSAYVAMDAQEKNYLLIGSYNLRVIIHSLLLDEDFLKRDYGFSSIISLMSEKPEMEFIPEAREFKNAYRKRCVSQDMKKDFHRETFQNIDYIIIDLLDEASDLIRIHEGSYITESEFLEEFDLPELKQYKRIPICSEERRKLFIQYILPFAENVRLQNIPVVVVKNFLCEKHSMYYDVSADYQEAEEIRKVNLELEWCYQQLLNQLPGAMVVDSSEFEELVFTYDDFPFGCKPVYYNTGYYQRMAIQIGRELRKKDNDKNWR